MTTKQVDDNTDAIDRNPFGPEAMNAAARLLSTEQDRAEVSGATATLARDGYCVIEGLLDRDQLSAIRSEMDRLNDQTPPSASTFGGYHTQRAFNLLGRSRAFDSPAAHRLVVAAVEAHLDDQIQLSETSTVTLGPGQSSQVLHHDDGCYPIPRPHLPLMVSAMWAIDDFIEANGATRVVPGSHLSEDVDVDANTVPLEMSAGSVGLWDGRLVHGGGANTTRTPRRGVAVLYARAWLRQQENQYLCLPPAVVARFERSYQRLLGWSLYGPHTGIVEGRDPKHLLE